jgi:hypothetical protein
MLIVAGAAPHNDSYLALLAYRVIGLADIFYKVISLKSNEEV